ncbi:MAG: hypothetical protein ACRD1R_04080 [Acidobacteriota bacterium]
MSDTPAPRSKRTFDEVIRIPLIISAPGQLKPERRAELIQQVDLYHRILWLAGLDKQPPDKPRQHVVVESVIAGNQTTRDREGILAARVAYK